MDDSDILCEKFIKALNELVGLECWAAIAGPGTGSRLALLIGAKIRRENTLRNEHVSEEVRTFNAEYRVLVEEASWRLESQDEVVATSTDSNHFGGVMLSGLNRIVSTVVSEVSCGLPGGDLSILFSSKLKLKVFPCSSNEIDCSDNYQLTAHHGTFVVGPRSVLRYLPSNHRE